MSLYDYINIDQPSSDGRGCYLNSSNVAHRLDDVIGNEIMVIHMGSKSIIGYCGREYHWGEEGPIAYLSEKALAKVYCLRDKERTW